MKKVLQRVVIPASQLAIAYDNNNVYGEQTTTEKTSIITKAAKLSPGPRIPTKV